MTGRGAPFAIGALALLLGAAALQPRRGHAFTFVNRTPTIRVHREPEATLRAAARPPQ